MKLPFTVGDTISVRYHGYNGIPSQDLGTRKVTKVGPKSFSYQSFTNENRDIRQITLPSDKVEGNSLTVFRHNPPVGEPSLTYTKIS